jgi:riboflavin biosynthesis pyrimidine reductase
MPPPGQDSHATADEDLHQAFALYLQEQQQRDYRLAHIGRVQTLLERWPAGTGVSHEKIEAVWDGPLLLPPSPDPALPYVLLMFVASLEGKVTLEEPAEVGGGETDGWLYGQAIRYTIDAVAGGRQTLCSTPPRLFTLFDPALVEARVNRLGKPRHPWQVVISGSGAVEANPFLLRVPEVPTIVITSEEGQARLGPVCAGRPNKHIVAVGPSARTLDLRRALEVLRSEFGIGQLVLIGGTGVATAFLEAGLVHELFLTRAPRLLGGQDRRTFLEGKGFPAAAAPVARLMTLKVGTVPWQDVLFQRWLLRPLP